jgi:flavin reductase (DIM6/NTAB) family NADH-FMN oxidoreductase RutF
MHICTYVSAVSMQPKQYIVALYHGTKTLELVEKTGEFLLQLLSSDQYNLVRLLGQESGHKKDKIASLQRRGLLAKHNGKTCLKDALALVECKVIDTMEGGDHKLFLCGVKGYRNLNPGSPLTTGLLKEKKIIRA